MAVAETSRSVGKGRSSGCKLKTRACPRSSPNPVASSIYVFNRPLANVAYAQEAINSIATGDASLAARFGGDTVDAGSNGTLNLNLNLNNASTETSQSSSHTGSDLVRQEMQGQGSQQESGHANVLEVGQLNINAAKVNVPLAQSLQQLTGQPGMGYLNQLLNDPALQGKVNWSAVELAHQHWDYAHEGLSPTGAVIVAIVVAYCTAGTASGAGASLATSAGMTVTYHHGGCHHRQPDHCRHHRRRHHRRRRHRSRRHHAGDPSQHQPAQQQRRPRQDPERPGQQRQRQGPGHRHGYRWRTGGHELQPNQPAHGQRSTVNGGAQTFTSQLGKNLQAGVARSLISTAINGGSLEESLKTSITAAFIDTGAAQGAFAIGSNFTGLANKLAHALAGCAAGAARAGAGEGCAAGAIGAAVGEMAAEAYCKRADTVEFAAMISAIAATVAGGDASQITLASQAGANAAANNFCAHNGCFNRRFDWNDAVDQWKNGNGVTVKDVNASELNLTDATYTKNPNGTYQIHTSISFDTGAIYGTVTGALNPDGTLSIRPDVYDFDQKNPLNAQTSGEFWRITFRDGLTALGAAMNGVGTPFRIEFSGSIPAPKELPK